MKRAALYYRVSTGDQTVEHQRHACRAFIADRGWSTIPEHEIEDVASGAKSRAGWGRVMQLARDGKVQVVVAWSLDRVARTLWAVADAVRELDKLGVPLITVKEPWLEISPTEDPLLAEVRRNLLITVFGFTAQFERQRLIDRTLAGQATARRKGKTFGRPRKLVGDALDAAITARLQGLTWGQVHKFVSREFRVTMPRANIARTVRRMIDELGGSPSATSDAGAPP